MFIVKRIGLGCPEAPHGPWAFKRLSKDQKAPKLAK
jgi:hypothetical protein